jgi:hypothetical protein
MWVRHFPDDVSTKHQYATSGLRDEEQMPDHVPEGDPNNCKISYLIPSSITADPISPVHVLYSPSQTVSPLSPVRTPPHSHLVTTTPINSSMHCAPHTRRSLYMQALNSTICNTQCLSLSSTSSLSSSTAKHLHSVYTLLPPHLSTTCSAHSRSCHLPHSYHMGFHTSLPSHHHSFIYHLYHIIGFLHPIPSDFHSCYSPYVSHLVHNTFHTPVPPHLATVIHRVHTHHITITHLFHHQLSLILTLGPLMMKHISEYHLKVLD